MLFCKYPSIENICHLERFVDQIPKDSIWVVKEKLHGANFSFSTNGMEMKIGKRTSFLEPSEYASFYHAQDILERYQSDIKALLEFLECKTLTVFGELYGGSYPNIKSTQKPVQREVLYCPQVDFRAFDIRVDGILLSDSKFEQLMIQFKIPFVANDFVGTLEECVEFSKQTNSLPSSIPQIHGLPSIENNIREGNVLKTTNVLYFKNGSRAIFKDKNKKFAEQNVVLKQKSSKIETKIEKDDEVIIPYLVEMRWNGIESKEGPCTTQLRMKYVSLFIQDAIEDYFKQAQIEWTPQKIKMIKKNLIGYVFEQEWFKTICYQQSTQE